MSITPALIIQGMYLVIQLIVVIVGIIFVYYLTTRTNTEKITQYFSLAKMVVTSIEQTLGEGNGADKRAEAQQALKQLTHNKLKDDEIDRLIEAAVYEMNTLLKIHHLKDPL